VRLSGAVVFFKKPSGAGCKSGDYSCGLEAGVRSKPIGFFGLPLNAGHTARHQFQQPE
jgi:hypothetical protein